MNDETILTCDNCINEYENYDNSSCSRCIRNDFQGKRICKTDNYCDLANKPSSSWTKAITSSVFYE